MTEFEYKVKWCPLCNQGWVQIVKEKNTGVLFVYCNECEAEWNSPENISIDNAKRDSFGATDVPSMEEIKNKGWSEFLM